MFEFIWKPPCRHEKITPDMMAGYCPDCGEYVKNCWYITRCECCGVKQVSLFKNGNIITNAKFCRNCGSSSFVTEELESIDIVNINYAVLQKKTVEIKKQSFVQTWIDENVYSPTKLLPSF